MNQKEKQKVTYLLPIWIDLKGKNPEAVMKALNDHLTEFFEEHAEAIASAGNTIDVQWTINKHIVLK